MLSDEQKERYGRILWEHGRKDYYPPWDALNDYLRTIFYGRAEAVADAAQRDLIARMIADTESSNVSKIVADIIGINGEPAYINQQPLASYLDSYLPTEDPDGN